MQVSQLESGYQRSTCSALGKTRYANERTNVSVGGEHSVRREGSLLAGSGRSSEHGIMAGKLKSKIKPKASAADSRIR